MNPYLFALTLLCIVTISPAQSTNPITNDKIDWHNIISPTYRTKQQHHADRARYIAMSESVDNKIFISVHTQTLYITDHKDRIIKKYPISTGLLGTGEKANTGKTPRGLHQIDQKIGHGHHPHQSFRARIPTQMYDPKNPGRDNILGRILVLDGQQSHNSNTKKRCIYIHGTGATWHLGKAPHSRGCVRMDPHDIVELYTLVNEGTAVYIYDQGNPLPWEKSAITHL